MDQDSKMVRVGGLELPQGITPTHSHAVMEGIPLPMVSMLLGHSNVSMTMHYAHISDAITEEVAEMIGVKIGRIIMGNEAESGE